MSIGADAYDELAHALVETSFDFDAVERGSLRAEWTEDGLEVRVTDADSGESVIYSGDDLALATSDREVENARQPEVGEG